MIESELIETWNVWLEGEKELAKLINQYNISLFFKQGKEIYGAPEESRIMFAQIANKEMDGQEAMFPAYNIKRIMETGEGRMKMFTKKDMNSIKVIEPDEVIKTLIN